MDNSGVDTSMNGVHDADVQDQSMMDMDDLFGDANDAMNNVNMDNVNLALPAVVLPPPPALIRRMADLQASGACTKLAWSNTGSIARISPDGLRVTFCVFVEDPKTGAWSPGKDSPHPIHAHDGSRFVHVQFSSLGHDLVVVDDVGLVHMFLAPTGLGRMHVSTSDFGFDRTGRNSTDAVAGLHWLPVWPAEFKTPYIGMARKANGSWSIPFKHRDPNSPRIHNPVDGKSALVYVSRNNCLTMLYQQESGRWYAVHKDLEHTALSEELITHASFCEYGNQLLLVTHDGAKRFRMLAISVEWNPSQQARPNGQQSIRVNPSLDVVHLAGLENVAAQHADLTQLTSLTLLPAVSDNSVDHQHPSPPTIVATFTHAALPSSTTQHLTERFTALCRWQLETVFPTMHESFGNLKQNNNVTPTLPPNQCLQRLPDQITMKLVLSSKLTSFGTLMAFIMSDGSVEFRDRSTFHLIEPSMDTTIASSLPHSGFEHEAGYNCIDAAVSHDASAMAYVQPDGKMEGKVMVFRHGWHHSENDGIVDGNGLVEAAVMCIARQHMILTWHSAATAETLSLLPQELSPTSYDLFFQQLARLSPKTYDTFSMDENKRQMVVLRDPHLPRALSAQLVLGTRPPSRAPTLPAQLAWVVLNLKHVTVSLMTTIGRSEATPSLGADFIHSLHGLVRWSVELFVAVLEALLTVERQITTQKIPAPQAIQEYIDDTNSPAIHLLLCSYPRTFLRYLAIYLTRYFKLQGQKITQSRSLLEKAQMLELARLGETLPFKLDAVLAFIVETEKGLLESYQQANIPERLRADLELGMITSCAIPSQLHAALSNLVATSLPKLSAELDVGKLFFWDTTSLLLTPRGGKEEERQVDALKKTPLLLRSAAGEGERLRRCRRCDSVMEDLQAYTTPTEANRELLPPWLQAAQRQCVCTCAWYLP